VLRFRHGGKLDLTSLAVKGARQFYSVQDGRVDFLLDFGIPRDLLSLHPLGISVGVGIPVPLPYSAPRMLQRLPTLESIPGEEKPPFWGVLEQPGVPGKPVPGLSVHHGRGNVGHHSHVRSGVSQVTPSSVSQHRVASGV
jgi:hypothetical protein